MQTQVLIVGGGPTGLALACQLARYGVDFKIIDNKETTTPFSRAIGVQARTLEIYEQMDLAEKLIGMGRIADMVRLVEGGRVRGEAVLRDIGAGMSPYPFLLIVEQGKHEAMLYDFLKSHGRDVDWRTELVDFTQDDSCVTATIRKGSGKPSKIKAQYLVGCDGAKSSVRHQLGLSFEGDTVDRLFYVADVRIDWQFSHDALHVCLARDTITAFFPMVGDHRWRIVGTFPEGRESDEGEILYAEIEEQIKRDTKLDLNITDVNWFSTYRVHSRAVNAFSKGRCFVAGDAAHIHTPAGAQGMNTGIQDGYNLAWKLAHVLNHRADPKLLDTYNEERLPNARRLLATTDRLFEFGASQDRLISYIRTHIFPHLAGFALSLDIVKENIFPLASQIGISYRDSSLSRDEADLHVKAGDRMPYIRLGSSIYDELREPRFHLITFGGDGSGSLIDEHSDIIDTHTLPLTDQVADLFRTDDPFMVLVRPDNYIGLVTTDIRAAKIDEYLDRIFPAA